MARLAELSPDARKLADIAAVLGGRATHEELAAASGIESAALIAAIDELRGADVLTERAESGDIVYDFSHPLLQETLYQELGLARTRTLHGTIAEALETLYGPRAMAHAGELAYHYARGDTKQLAAKAVRYLRAAGRDASAKYANREAADYLATALSIAEEDVSGDRDELGAELARVRQRLGDYAGAMELWQQALEAARVAGDVAKVASIERSIGLARYWSGAFAEALAHYDAATQAARQAGDRTLEARVLVAKASALQAIGRTAESRTEIESALAIAKSLGDEGCWRACTVPSCSCMCGWDRPSWRGAWTAGDRARGVIGQRSVAWSAHWALAMLEGSRVAEATRRHIGEAQRIADELRSPLFRAWISEVEIEYAAGVGDWDHAVARAADDRRGPLAGQRTLLPRVLVCLGLLYLGRGDVERGKACVDEAWELAIGGGSTPAMRDGSPRCPRTPGVRRITSRWASTRKPSAWGSTGWDRGSLGTRGVGDSSLDAGDRGSVLWANDMQRASEIGERMRRQSTALGQQLGLAWATACDAPRKTLRRRHVGFGVAVARGGGCAGSHSLRTGRGATARQLARALARRATVTRRCASSSARTKCSRISVPSVSWMPREQLRELGARPPARTTTQGVGGLTGREIEIVRLVALVARTGDRRGARHFRPHRKHAPSNIFAKLGVECAASSPIVRERRGCWRTSTSAAAPCRIRFRSGCARAVADRAAQVVSARAVTS